MEENKQMNEDVVVSGEMATVVSDKMAEVNVNDYSGSGNAPKKSKKALWITLLLVVVIAAALAPFGFAMARQAQLRKNPDAYVLDAMNRTDYKKSRAYEMSLEFGEEARDYWEREMMSLPSGVTSNDFFDFVESFTFKFTHSDADMNATDAKPIVKARYDFLYDNKDIIGTTMHIGEKGIVIEIAGKKIYISSDLKYVKPSKEQERLQNNLKKDKEVQNILREMLSKSELVETDAVESVTGQKTDVLKIKISVLDLYETLKKFVNIMDTNENLKAYIKEVVESVANAAEEQGESVDMASIRGVIDSGMYLSFLKQAIRTYDRDIVDMLEETGIVLEGNLYVNAEGIIRSDLRLSFNEIRSYFFTVPTFSVRFNSYIAALSNDGTVSEEGTVLSLDSSTQYIPNEINNLLESLRADIVDEMKNSPGFKELRKFLDKMMDVDEWLESVRR
ncbi:MAG: hypothetical protein Q4A41_00860 [Bacillota bacterium]|nr:hypothetical protein [Bacillota bacterium]